MIEIIPAIDIIEGKCVRLEKGDYTRKKVYSSDPVEVARMFESWGLKRLHVVDLDGAKASHIINHKVLKKITSATSLVVDFGGGIKTDNDLRIAFENGASMVTCGSIAVKSRELVLEWLELYGGDKILLGSDHRNGRIAVSGWMENSDIELIGFIKDYHSVGITKIICTDIEKDGMLSGPSYDIYKHILSTFNDLYLIASGGVSSVSDIHELDKMNVPAVIVGKAIYEGNINASNIKPFLL